MILNKQKCNEMELFIFIAILLFVLGLMAYIFYRERAKMLLLPDDEDPYDLVKEEEYNKYPLWISEQEREVWDSLSRKEKRKRMQLVEKGIKQGRFVIHTDENGFTGLISKKEAQEKGIL